MATRAHWDAAPLNHTAAAAAGGFGVHPGLPRRPRREGRAPQRHPGRDLTPEHPPPPPPDRCPLRYRAVSESPIPQVQAIEASPVPPSAHRQARAGPGSVTRTRSPRQDCIVASDAVGRAALCCLSAARTARLDAVGICAGEPAPWCRAIGKAAVAQALKRPPSGHAFGNAQCSYSADASRIGCGRGILGGE